MSPVALRRQKIVQAVRNQLGVSAEAQLSMS